MGHRCEGRTLSSGHGDAISSCVEDDAGHFVVSNMEYGSQVNFCPYCGARASTPAEPAQEWQPIR